MWRAISEYEGFYEASSDGKVRSINRIVRYKDGSSRKWPKLELKQGLSNGYKQIFLSKNGKSRAFKVHNIILFAFLGFKSSSMTVNHKDGNKFNNKLSNLEYITMLDNVRHGFKNGLMAVGSNNNLSKLTDAQVIAIRYLSRSGMKPTDIATNFKITYQNVWLIVNRKSWRHL